VRFVVFGAAGQLGRDLCPLLPGEVVALDRSRVELTDPEAVRAVLQAEQPDVVVNCAAYNFVDRAETEPDNAFAVNAWAVRTLAQWCGQHDRALVHFSTDHVFGLEAGRATPWLERDPPGPINLYGLSKLTGEYLVRALCPRHLVIRTCGLYGHHGSGGKGTNFVETMLRLAGQGKPLKVVADQVCTPSAAREVARGSVALLRVLLSTGTAGLFHLTNEGACSWYEFATAIFELTGLPADLTPISSAAWGARARRPMYSVLSNEAARGLGVRLPPWREALTDYLRQRNDRSERQANSNP
jgi:dTDP-4-dehydrorhamnose reductase